MDPFIYKMNETKKILFVSRYRNCSWGYIDEGRIITSDGNIYDFEFSSRLNKTLDDALIDVIQTQLPSKQTNKDEVLKAHSLIQQIDENAKMMLMPFGDDAGQNSLIAFYNDKKYELATIGDHLGFIDCPVVDEILDFLEKIDFYKWECMIKKYRVSELSEKWKNQSGIQPIIKDPFY